MAVTCVACGLTNDLWIGTTRGAIRKVEGEFQYFAGRRWLPGERVNAIACGRAQFPPRSHCAHCHAGSLSWQISAGIGRIQSFTIVHRAPTPAFRGMVPYPIALVAFDEGFQLLLNVKGAAPASLAIGQTVRVVFEQLEGGQWLPQAEPSGTSGTSEGTRRA